MKKIVFDANGISNIPLDVLKQTRSSQMFDGHYHTSCPMESWECVEKLVNIVADSTKTNPIIDSLLVYRDGIDRNYELPAGLRDLNKNHPDRSAFEQNLTLDKLRIDRFIGKALVKLGSDEIDFAIGFSYNSEPGHLKKISIGVGTNLHICSNFQILGNELATSFTRYEQRGMKFTDMMEKVTAWVNDYNKKFEYHNMVLQNFRDRQLSNSMLNEAFGEMLAISRFENFPKDKKESLAGLPGLKNQDSFLTATQVGHLVDESFNSLKFPRLPDGSATAYELLNWGTDILNFKRARHNTIDTLLPGNKKFCNYMVSRFITPQPSNVHLPGFSVN